MRVHAHHDLDDAECILPRLQAQPLLKTLDERLLSDRFRSLKARPAAAQVVETTTGPE